MNVLFWAALYFLFRKKWILAIAFILTPITFNSMVYFRFHDWHDIFGGVCFGLAEALMFYLLINRLDNLKVFALLIFSITIALYNGLPNMPTGYYNSIWQILGVFCTLVLCIFLNNRQYIKPRDYNYGMLYAFCVFGFLLITPRVSLLHQPYMVLKVTEGFLISATALLILPFIVNIVTARIKK
jgi:hypothetical protein